MNKTEEDNMVEKLQGFTRVDLLKEYTMKDFNT